MLFSRLALVRLLISAMLITGSNAAKAMEPEDNGTVRFDIARFAVTGNTLLPASTVDSALQPFLGAKRSFDDVRQALETLESAYRARGFKLVKIDVPEQILDRGVIDLRVIETLVDHVTVTGHVRLDETNIRRSLPDLQEGESPNLDTISRALKLANENPAKKVTLNLQSSATVARVDATLNVEEESPWRAALDISNSGTQETGRTNLSVSLQYANLWNQDHVGSISYSSTVEEPGKVSIYGAGYRIPLYAMGDTIDLFGSYSNVDSGTVAAGLLNLAISGKGSVFGARYNQSLAKTDDMESKLIYGIDHKNFRNDLLTADQNFGNSVTVRPLSLTYVVQGPAADGDINLSLSLLRNVPGGAHGREADFAEARVGAQADYSMARIGIGFARSLPDGWQLRAQLNGQFTRDALVPGEQLGVGGATTVRGLPERELAADSGLIANLELYTPNLCADHPSWQCRALAFYDAAQARRNNALPGELTSTTVGSAGIGLRLAAGRSLNLQVDYGHVVQAGAITSQDRNRVHGRATWAY